MTSCSQLVDIEELVTGELDPSHAAALRAHAAECGACGAELELAIAERALFARRAEAMAPPPPSLAFAVRERLAGEIAGITSPLGPRITSLVGLIMRRGHVSVACAAALFIVAAFSRATTGTMTFSSSSEAGEGEVATSGMLASFRVDEPLACSMGAASSSHDDGPSAASSTSLASMQEARACAVPSSRSRGGCEAFVTCSSLRQ